MSGTKRCVGQSVFYSPSQQPLFIFAWYGALELQPAQAANFHPLQTKTENLASPAATPARNTQLTKLVESARQSRQDGNSR